MSSTSRRSAAPPWGLLFASLLSGLLGQFLLWTWHRPHTSSVRILLGWALMALGGALLLKAWRRLQKLGDLGLKDKPWPVWGEALALAFFVLLALALRTAKLDSYPNAGFRDEGEAGNVAISIMNGEPVTNTGTSTPVYIEEVYQNPAGYFYPAALMLKTFGVSMKSVRLTGVMWGVLSVAFFFFVARALLGFPLALFLTLVLCGLRWHLNFSRVALIAMHTLSLELPAMYFLWRGVNEADSGSLKRYPYLALFGALGLAFISYLVPFAEWGGGGALSWLGWLIRLLMHLPLLWCVWRARGDRRSLWFAAAGAALGFCLYSYLASRLVLISCVVIWAGFFLREQGSFSGRRGWALLLSVASAVLGVLMLAQGSAWAGPLASAGAKSLAPLAKLAGGLLLLGGALGLGILKLLALRQPGSLDRWLRPLLLAVAGCWFVAAPLNNYMVRHHAQMFSRTQRVWVWGNEDYDDRPWGGKMLQSVKHTLGMINVQGDGNPRHNDPGRPMFNPLLAAFFGLGAFFLLLRLGSSPLALFLFLWLQCHWLAGYLGIEAPQAFRSLGSLPAALLIAGQAFLPWVYALRAELRRGWRVFTLALLGIVAAGAMLWDGYDYFVNQPKHPGVWSEFSAGEYNMGKELKAMQPNTRGIFRADWADSWTVRFMTYPERNYEGFDVVKHVPLDPKQAIPGSDYYYVLDAAYKPLASLLQDYYPNGVYKEFRHPLNNELVYWSFLAKAADIASVRTAGTGLSARYFKDHDDGKHWQAKDLVLKRVDPFLLFNWTVSPVSGHFSAEWTGTLKAPLGGTYFFHAYSNNIVSLEIDGRSIFNRKDELGGDAWTEGQAQLSAGRHSIRFRYAETRNYSRVELWWTVPGKGKAVVPGAALLP